MKDDLVQPFQIDGLALRGRLVRLGPALDRILSRHTLAAPVAGMLGEAVAVAAALAGALKYEGMFTLQTKGDGPIRMMVADVSSKGALRGYVQTDETKLAAVEIGRQGPVPALLGHGHLAFTVDQGEHSERYQGIVALEGATLAQCVQQYFRRSEQVEAGILVAAAETASGWRAGALMIQRLPPANENVRPAEDEAWHRAMVLMSSLTAEELVDPALSREALLYRLFHEDGVRVWPPGALVDSCRCSRARVEQVLRLLPREDLADMMVEGRVTVKCEFCGVDYGFDGGEVQGLMTA